MRKSRFSSLTQRLGSQAAALCLCSSLVLPTIASAQSDNWFQIEVTLFTFEDANLALENWPAEKLSIGFPERLRELKQVAELLQLSQWSQQAPTIDAIEVNSELDTPENELALEFGPSPYAPNDTIFTLPDFEREAMWMLPSDAHDFTGTNRALNQSADQRVVYHAAWRQILTRRASANAIAIMAGRRFDERRELEGSLNFYLTGNADRVILESNLWLNSFTTQASSEAQWRLPVLPEMLVQDQDETASTQFHVNRIIPFRQNRDIRSDEFHYLDHPALGMLVQISPYTVPPLPLPPLELQDPNSGLTAP